MEDNWDSLFSKMYKKPFCLATECEITNVASGNKDFTGGYTLSTESVSIKVDNEWIIGKEREFTTDGYTIPITINPNNFWEWLGSMFNSIEYEYEIIEDTDNILESHEMDGNQLKVTVNKIGHAEIKVTASPWLFFDFGEQIILLNIISPAVSEDAIRFNGQDWRTFSNGLVDGWTDQNVEVTVEHPYYNQIQAFYTKGGETKQIGDGNSDSIVLNVQSMTDYTFRLTHSDYGTRYEVSAQLGIDTTKPTYDADSIKTVAPSEGIPKADTLYYKEEAQAEGKFRDAQSGLEKVIITGYSKEAWEDDWRAFSEELTPDGDGVVSYTLRYGVYKNLVFSAYDKVGNHVDDIKIGDTELIVVDDRKPSVAVDAKLIWSDGNFSDYDGSWTNKQIQMEVTVTNNLSGIASVQYAYVPNGTADSVNKNWVTMDAEAVIGIAPSDVKALTTAKNTRIVLDEEYFKNGTVYFSHFYNSSVEISTSAEFGVSELGSYKICEARKSGDWNKNGTNWHSFNKDEGSFSLSPNARCFFYVVAEDQAGNETVVRSEGVVTDKEAPIGKDGTELTIRPVGENKNGFFNKDFDVEIAVQDSPTDDDCAALKEVTYLISNSDDKSNTEKIFSFNNSNPTSSQLSAAQEFEETVKIDAEDYESNTAYIEVTAVDNSGNERITQQELKIDVTAPEITVTYDNNEALHEKYYQRNRTAKIHIHELNFDASDVEFEITKDGVDAPGMAPSPASWESDGDDHYAYITFAEDGDYTLTLSYTDLADNEAVYDTVDEFTIDKTKPVVTVDYNNDTPWKDIYYNTARTATITVEEHNFDAKDFVLSAVPARTISGWTHNGDTHTTTIAFTEDGEYTYSFDFVDLAGNAMAPFTEEHFKIDTVEPVVEIRGIEDQSANAGDVMPVVVVQDENFDMGGVEISLRNGRGQEVSLVRNLSAIENGYQYTLPQ